jgi:hypothetical protein
VGADDVEELVSRVSIDYADVESGLAREAPALTGGPTVVSVLNDLDSGAVANDSTGMLTLGPAPNGNERKRNKW